jgi:hypothetical protein
MAQPVEIEIKNGDSPVSSLVFGDRFGRWSQVSADKSSEASRAANDRCSHQLTLNPS